jgi:hypothetical protein
MKLSLLALFALACVVFVVARETSKEEEYNWCIKFCKHYLDECKEMCNDIVGAANKQQSDATNVRKLASLLRERQSLKRLSDLEVETQREKFPPEFLECLRQCHMNDPSQCWPKCAAVVRLAAVL